MARPTNKALFAPGHKKLGGRSRGTPNRSTANAREAIARFVDGNADRLQQWLDDIAERDGSRAAFECFMSLVEFHVPKLTRSELRALPTYDGPTLTVTDPLEAPRAYLAVVHGEVAPEAVRFETPPEAAVVVEASP